MLNQFTLAALQVLGQMPNPGKPAPPPGADKLLKLLTWAEYGGYAVCILGVIIAAGGMAMQHRQGTIGEHGGHLGFVLVGSLLIGAASTLVAGVA